MKKTLFLMFLAATLSFTFATGNVVQRWNLCIDLDSGKIVNWEKCWIQIEESNTIETNNNLSESTETSTWTNDISTSINTWATESEIVETDIPVWNISEPTNNENTTKIEIIEEKAITEVIKPTIQSGIIFSWQDELTNAILRMYANWLTKFQTKEEYMVDSPLTREQMSKMISQVYVVLWYQSKENTNSCDFWDLKSADNTLQSFITKSCELWLLNWRDNNFHPHVTLSKAQALTIMIRLFEGKKSDETSNPRRKNYITKAQAIWLTKETNPDKFEKPIPRWEVALLFYRFKSLVENTIVQQNSMKEMQDSVAWTSNANKKMNSETLDDALSLLTQWISAWDDPELREAVFRMYQQKMTEYDGAEHFRSFEQIERQEAAKFLWVFHQQFIKTWAIRWEIPTECYFKDLQDSRDILRDYILYDCAEWIFNGVDWWFHPTHSLKKSEFVASLIRMLWKTYTATWDIARRKPYFDQWLKLWLISYVDRITFDKPITRYEVALILYRFRIKYQLLANLNSDNIENMVISMIENSEKTINNKKQWKVYITVTKLKDQNFSMWYIDLFGKKYKIIKKSIKEVFTNNFVRYWEVYDMVTDKAVWTLSLIVWNSTILEWNIRPSLESKTYYKISKPEETNAYYIIREEKEEVTE